MSRNLHTIALLLLVAIVLGRICAHEFVNIDDDKFLYANSHFTPPTVESLHDHWRQPHAHLYVPVAMTFWWLIAHLATVHDASGVMTLNPWIFHAASLLVHAGNVLLVWWIVRAIVRDDRAAVLGAAVFAVHPLQVETVAWASEMKDLLGALFALLAIAAAVNAIGGPARRRRLAWWGGAFLCYAAALLSKPSMVMMPVIAFVVLWLIGASRSARWTVLLAGLALAVPVVLITRRAQPAADVPPVSIVVRPLVAADALAFYLAKTVFPATLALDYGRTPAAIMRSGAICWTWLAPLAVTVLVLLSRRRLFIGAWLLFIVAVAPNLGLLPFDFQIVSTVADHYVYLALLGVALAVAVVATHAHAQRAAIAIVIALAVVSFIQAGRWRDSLSLWRHNIAVNPRSGLANVNLGASLLTAGDAEGAVHYLAKAAELDPNDPFAYLGLARARLAIGDTAGAAQSALDLASAYKRRADYDPALTAAVLNRFADAIAQHGDTASAALLRDEVQRLRRP